MFNVDDLPPLERQLWDELDAAERRFIQWRGGPGNTLWRIKHYYESPSAMASGFIRNCHQKDGDNVQRLVDAIQNGLGDCLWEHIVLHPRYRSLFNDELLEIAWSRLNRALSPTPSQVAAA
jgi:hypothetical protein